MNSFLSIPSIEEYEVIWRNLGLIESLPNDINANNAFEFLVDTLKATHVSRFLFNQNCENYNLLILINLEKSPRINDGELREILSIKCLEMLLNHNSSIAFSRLTLPLDYSNILSNFPFPTDDPLLLVDRVLNEFKKGGNGITSIFFPSIISEKICDRIIFLISNKSNLLNDYQISSSEWEQIFHCLYKYPTRSEFAIALISNKDIDSEGLVELLRSMNPPIFLESALKSIRDNHPDDLISILENWKIIVQFIIEQELNNQDMDDDIFFYLIPAYSLKSTIFSLFP